MKYFLSIVTIIFGILAFVLALLVSWRLGRRSSLSRLLGASMGASAIPIGVVFIYCAFDPTALAEISNASIYVALAGLAVIFVGCRSFAEQAELEDYLTVRSQRRAQLAGREERTGLEGSEMRPPIAEPPAGADG